jgi:hypothetical protein
MGLIVAAAINPAEARLWAANKTSVIFRATRGKLVTFFPLNLSIIRLIRQIELCPRFHGYGLLKDEVKILLDTDSTEVTENLHNSMANFSPGFPSWRKTSHRRRVVSFVRSAFVILLLYRLKKFRDIILNLSQEHVI